MKDIKWKERNISYVIKIVLAYLTEVTLVYFTVISQSADYWDMSNLVTQCFAIKNF